MKSRKILAILTLATLSADAQHQAPSRRFEPVSFSQVTITDGFWKPALDKVATTTLQACVFQTEVKTPRIKNFEKVARRQGEKHEGIFYDDSDVYKALEAIAYSLKNHPDAALEKKADEWIDKIAAAQLNDGYIGTWYTLGGIDKRWTDMSMHEDYNGGHLIEAAVAYYNSTGKKKLLDVAIKFANHFDNTFGPGKQNWVTGHQELELALVKLYKTTKDKNIWISRTGFWRNAAINWQWVTRGQNGKTLLTRKMWCPCACRKKSPVMPFVRCTCTRVLLM